MSTTMTLLQARTAIRQRADMENASGVYANAFIKDPELTSYINQSYFELYDLLLETYEKWFMAPPLLITTQGNSNLVALPDGTLYTAAPAFYKLWGIDLGLDASGNALVTLGRFNFIDRNNNLFPQLNANALAPSNLKYDIVGTNIMFQPRPSAGQTIQLWYSPRLTQLSGDSDTIDGISGWTEYIICDGAIKCGQKEETDVSVLMAQKQALIKRIQSVAQDRDVGQPKTISDTRRATGRYRGVGDYGGFGGY